MIFQVPSHKCHISERKAKSYDLAIRSHDLFPKHKDTLWFKLRRFAPDGLRSGSERFRARVPEGFQDLCGFLLSQDVGGRGGGGVVLHDCSLQHAPVNAEVIIWVEARAWKLSLFLVDRVKACSVRPEPLEEANLDLRIGIQFPCSGNICEDAVLFCSPQGVVKSTTRTL